MPVAAEIRRLQLLRLVETLHDLLGILRAIPACPHTAHFSVCAERAAHFLSHGFTQRELTDLSATICHAYGEPCGRGTFASYETPAGLSETTNFDTFRRAAFDRALALRNPEAE